MSQSQASVIFISDHKSPASPHAVPRLAVLAFFLPSEPPGLQLLKHQDTSSVVHDSNVEASGYIKRISMI